MFADMEITLRLLQSAQLALAKMGLAMSAILGRRIRQLSKSILLPNKRNYSFNEIFKRFTLLFI